MSRKAPRVVKSEDEPAYAVTPQPAAPTGAEDAIIAQALAILARRVKERPVMGSPAEVKQYLALYNARFDADAREAFSVLLLDSHHRVIECETLFVGTLAQASVYPREVVRAALRHNACAVILSHNHPSTNTAPSRADEVLTQTLKSALALVDVRLLDHIITGAHQALSMAEQGLV